MSETTPPDENTDRRHLIDLIMATFADGTLRTYAERAAGIADALAVDGYRRLTHRSHPHNYDCLGCGESVRVTALVDVVYAFETCDCDAADYQHLAERLWHRGCFAAAPVVGGSA